MELFSVTVKMHKVPLVRKKAESLWVKPQESVFFAFLRAKIKPENNAKKILSKTIDKSLLK